MKKLLAIALMAVYPLFGDVKNDNARLLAHLKMVKADYILERLGPELCEEHISSNAEFQLLNFMLKVARELYSTSEILQKIVAEQIARPEFDVICNNVVSIDQIIKKIDELPVHIKMNEVSVDGSDFHPDNSIKITAEEKRNLFALFVPIYKKLGAEFDDKNKIFAYGGCIGFATESGDDMKEAFDYFLGNLISMPETLGKDWPLLKMVDAKIAELEKIKR